jgi:hypothetical protein
LTARGGTRSCSLAVVAVLLLLTGCSSKGAGATTPSAPVVPSGTLGARPPSPAKLAILSPTDGEVVHGSSVMLQVSLKDAKIVPSTTLNVVPDQGHLHVYLDGALVTMTASLRTDIPNVTPGQHLLRVEFVASDHAPFDPRVIRQVAFEAKK